MNTVENIANDILTLAYERLQDEEYQNMNSAIHSVMMDLTLILMDVMKYNKGE
jgi:hypothetical protein